MASPSRPTTLPERLEEAAGRAGAGALTFVTGGTEDVVPWGAFLDDARAMVRIAWAIWPTKRARPSSM